MAAKYRVVYTNLKTGKSFDICCMDKVYRTIKKMEANCQAKISFDERETLDKRDNEMNEIVRFIEDKGIDINTFIEWLDKQ